MRQRVIIWCVAILFSVLVIGSAVGSVAYFVGQASLQNQRRHDNCVSRRNLYDGQFVIVHFIAKQLHATRTQEADGIHALRKTLGPRPQC